jgi:hypothetical protein
MYAALKSCSPCGVRPVASVANQAAIVNRPATIPKT